MGVQGLMTVCLERQNECTEAVDLVEIARQRNGIELIVDFASFKHHLIYRFWTGLSAVRNNPYIKILGGEYSSMERYVTKLIEDLKSLEIQLVFLTDGEKGSSTEAFLQKKDTWIKRDKQNMENICTIFNVCEGQVNNQDLDDETSFLPLLLEDQFMAAAKKCDCKFYQNPAGEADLMLIRALREREKAYAILSNDSDFCIFPDSRFIPIQLFDIENDLQLGKPVEVPEKPLRLKVKVITTERIKSMLQLRNDTELVEMAIVSGNDYTRQFMRGCDGYLQMLGFEPGWNLEAIARLISNYRTVESHPFLYRKMWENREFRNAVEYTRNVYSLRVVDAPPQRCNFSQRIAGGIESGIYPTIFMSIHNSYYWHKMILEDISFGQPRTERALIPLRIFIYRILLPRHRNLLEEIEISLSGNMPRAVLKVEEDSTVPSLDAIIEHDIRQNLRHFHRIICHQEREQDTGYWFDHCEMKVGFTIYLLRYFLLQNWKCNLHLSKNEYLALVAMVFSENDEAEYQRVVIKPTMRCVTIGSWFQNLYRHVSMLASVLSIKNEFPLPSEIFCGSRWTAMYMAYTDQYVGNAHGQVKVRVDSIIEEKHDMIHHIVQGIFPLVDQ